MRLKSIRTHWRRFRALSSLRRGLLLEAAAALTLARIQLLFVSFPRIGAGLGKLRPPVGPGDPGRDDKSAGDALNVAWAIDRAAAVLPFAVVCLPRALAGYRLLRRRGVSARLHFGASRQPGGPLSTHAWLEAGGVEVTGYPEARACTELGFYAR